MEKLSRDWWTLERDMQMLRLLRSNRTFLETARSMRLRVSQVYSRAAALGVREGFSKTLTGEEIQELDARDRDAQFVQLLYDAYKRGEFPK